MEASELVRGARPDLPWGSPERQQAMAEGKVFGDPDDAERSKAKALIEFGKWFKRKCQSTNGSTGGITPNENLQIYWWIDWACTDQDNPDPDMAALPAYAAVCHGIVAAWNGVYKGARAAPPPAPRAARPSPGNAPAATPTTPLLPAAQAVQVER